MQQRKNEIRLKVVHFINPKNSHNLLYLFQINVWFIDLVNNLQLALLSSGN